MLVSVKPFSSPLYEEAALKNATLSAFCKISTLMLQDLFCSAFRLCTKERRGGGCIFRGCVNCIEMCLTGSNKTILIIICYEEPQKVVERCLRAPSAYMQLCT